MPAECKLIKPFWNSVGYQEVIWVSCGGKAGRPVISQEELAMRIGGDQAYISRIEAGWMNVRMETAEQVAEVVQSDVAVLLGKVG